MTHTFENYVDERLAALERQNRRLRRGLTALAAFVLVQVLAAAGWFLLPPPVLKAKKFVAVDRDGNPRVELDATNPDMANVSLYDRQGKLQASLCENGGRSPCSSSTPTGISTNSPCTPTPTGPSWWSRTRPAGSGPS
jgi:hypothetical protein